MIKVCIIGDRFMSPKVFEAALPAGAFDCLLHELAWPDEPFVNACEEGVFKGLKEFMGEADTIASMIGDAQVLITHLAPISAAILERCPKLELIAVSRGGPVNIDREACQAKGVTVVNAPGRNASAVAEFTIGAILMETRMMRAGHEALRQGVWRGDLYRADITGPEMSELTVGLIGYGQIGTRVAKLLKPFGCRIVVADPYKTLAPEDAADGVVMTDLSDLLAQADVVSLHARVTDETRGFLAAAQFKAMKPGSWFINTARGPMVNYEDLYNILASGHLRGAMLETFWQEPPPVNAPLLRLPNVTLTPHIAGASTTTVRIAATMVAAEIRRWQAGEPLLNPC